MNNRKAKYNKIRKGKHKKNRRKIEDENIFELERQTLNLLIRHELE